MQTAAQGLAELEGFAWPKHPGPKNVHGDPLGYYHFQLQKQVTTKSGKNTRREWKTVFSRTHATPEKVNLTGLSIFSAQVFDRNARKIKAIQSLFDLNGNGKINYHELSHGYLKLARFARTQHGREQSHQTEFTVYGVLQHSEEHGLLLADTHQTQLIDSLKSRTWMFMAAGCVLLTLASVLWFRAK